MEPAAEWSVLLGVHSQDGPRDAAHVRAVAAIRVPDNYSGVELGADLALLRLASPARLGPAARTRAGEPARRTVPWAPPVSLTGLLYVPPAGGPAGRAVSEGV